MPICYKHSEYCGIPIYICVVNRACLPTTGYYKNE